MQFNCLVGNNRRF